MDDKEAAEMSTGVYPPVFHFTRQWGIYVFKFYKNF